MMVYGPLCAVIITSVVELIAHVPNTVVSMYLISAIGVAIVLNQVSTYLENNRLHASLEERLRELSEREERHRITVDEMGDAVVVLDATGELREVTSRWTDMLGWSVADSVGKSFAAFAHPDELGMLRDVFEQAIVSSRMAALTTRGLCADGSYRWLEVEITNLVHVPLIEGLLCVVRDVEERLSAAGRLRRAEERFRVAFAAAPIGMTVTAHGVLLEVNEAFAAMLGYTSSELVGVPVAELTVPEDHRIVMAGLAQLGAGEKATHSGEQRYVHRTGRVVLGSVSLSMVHDRDDGALVIGQIEDITERREIEGRMHWAARHDDVTGLYNRAYFMERLGESLSTLVAGCRLAVVFLDLDRFKLVNDSLGHGSGDDLLRVVARRLVATMRATDVVARFGGDEFTILLDPAPSEEQVILLAERLADELAKPIPLATGDVYVTASLGVAFADRAGLSGEHLIRDADAAMYRAKERGRNRIERFDEETHASVVRNLRTGNDLHRALERHEFEVHYQPVWSIRNQQVVGFEALVRWRHPERGLVLPGDFIGLAEDTGLIVPIGAQVLESALQQLARWQEEFDYAALTMAVNLSARQLGSPNLVETLRGALHRASVDPGKVWLEITESALMTDVKASELTLRALRALGVRLSVDDFGTGYSSLTYLKRFPVEGLKIDRSFVDGLGTDEEDGTIVEAVVRLGLALGLKVVAEGVENVVQLDYLATTGCDYGQGHLVSPPVPADELELALRRGALSFGRIARD
jgi:diguanylate cyclase (GGDEF)-like protein/PAS domain S-box-containing protein